MIELKNLTKTYGDGFTALEDVNLQISDGEFVFIVGGSGAGKSTLVALLIAEDKPMSGEISVDGWELSSLKKGKIPFYRRKLGIVFRDFRLFSDKTVYENVAFALRVIGEPSSSIRMKVNAALRMVELSDKGKCYIDELSGCEQQKVALARALANGAGIIIADEPCGNMDPVQSRELVELFCRIQSRYQKTVILLTHDRELAESFGLRTIYLGRGKIIDDVAAYSPDEEILAEAKTQEDEPETEEDPSLPASEPVTAFGDLMADEDAADDTATEMEEAESEETTVSEDMPEEVSPEEMKESEAESAKDDELLPVEEVSVTEPNAAETQTQQTEESADVTEEIAEPMAEPAGEEEVLPAAEAMAVAVLEPDEEIGEPAEMSEATDCEVEPETDQVEPSLVEYEDQETVTADGAMKVRSMSISTDALESVLADLFGNTADNKTVFADTDAVSDSSASAEIESANGEEEGQI